MQLSPDSGARGGDDNLIPLINVVFLMLVFFMVAGQILPADAFRINLPSSQVTTPAPAESIVILVGADGRVALEGNELPVLELADALRPLLQRPAGNAQVQVSLKADAELPMRELNQVLDALRAAGASNVKLFTAGASA
jgi:biopolymer transport protein ExbD